MKITTLSKSIVLSLLVLGLSACSAFKNRNSASVAPLPSAEQEATETTGLGDDEASFADEDSSHRLSAPYNQVYHFDFDGYNVHSDDIASLNAQAEYLVQHRGAKVRLEGNADERGSREYNIALGWKRAKAVAEVLKQEGVADKQIAMVSYGKEKPIAFGHDEESYAQNRRVALVYEAS